MDGAGVGGGWERLLVECWNATACTGAFLSFFLFLHIDVFPLSSPFSASVAQTEKERENRRPSLLQGDNSSFFYLPLRRALTTAAARPAG